MIISESSEHLALLISVKAEVQQSKILLLCHEGSVMRIVT
jgi:hypothetical protein